MIRIAQHHISKENLMRGLAILSAVVVLWLTLKALFALGSQDELTERANQAVLQNNKPDIQHDALFGSYEGNGPLQETGLNIQLTGVFATQDPMKGSAVISVSGRKALLLTVGDKISGGAIIKEVYTDYVVLEEAGQRACYVSLKKRCEG